MRIGLANGCFDGLHPGHEFFLKRAREHCDWLIVAVNNDWSVTQLKGAGRPVRTLEVRMRALSGTAYPQAVIPFDGDAARLIEQIGPDVVIRGEDQQDDCPEGLTVIRIPRLRGFSTTGMLATGSPKAKKPPHAP